MFDKPKDQWLSACARLLGHEDFQIFLEGVKQELDLQDKQNRVLDQPQLGRGQGISIALASLVEKIEQASKTLSIRREKSR